MKGFLDPVAWIWISLLFLGLWLLWVGRRRFGVVVVLGAVFWSVVERFAVPARLLASRESAYLGTGVDDMDETAFSFDAVVMLGGVLMPASEFAGAQYLDSVDRVLTATTLALRSGKPLVMGGGIAGEAGSEREPEYTKRWFKAWGMDSLQIEDLGAVRNTRDEAMATERLVRERGWKRVALVTSAWHLQRAEGAFRQVGVVHEPVAGDFRGTSELEHGGAGWLPRAESALLVRLWLTEWIGEAYYRHKDWWSPSRVR